MTVNPSFLLGGDVGEAKWSSRWRRK